MGSLESVGGNDDERGAAQLLWSLSTTLPLPVGALQFVYCSSLAPAIACTISLPSILASLPTPVGQRDSMAGWANEKDVMASKDGSVTYAFSYAVAVLGEWSSDGVATSDGSTNSMAGIYRDGMATSSRLLCQQTNAFPPRYSLCYPSSLLPTTGTPLGA
jgi:hypothetical protein